MLGSKVAQERRLTKLEVFGFESGVFGDSRKHFRTNFDGIVESPGVVAHRGVAELDVGTA